MDLSHISSSSSQVIEQQLRNATKQSLILLRTKINDHKNRVKWLDLFSVWRLVELQNTLDHGLPFQDTNVSNFQGHLEQVLATLSKETDVSGGMTLDDSAQY